MNNSRSLGSTKRDFLAAKAVLTAITELAADLHPLLDAIGQARLEAK